MYKSNSIGEKQNKNELKNDNHTDRKLILENIYEFSRKKACFFTDRMARIEILSDLAEVRYRVTLAECRKYWKSRIFWIYRRKKQ